MLDKAMMEMMAQGIWDTCYMTIVATFFGYVIGLPLGIALTLSDENGITPNRAVYRILDIIINITRSIPFLILLILVMPLTKLLVGKTYGSPDPGRRPADWPDGGVFPEGSSCRGHRGGAEYGCQNRHHCPESAHW